MNTYFTQQSDWFHGTDRHTVIKLANAGILVTSGGGELGQGFYVGDKQREAKRWAANKHNSSTVLQVTILDSDFFSLALNALSHHHAVVLRARLRKTGATRSYISGSDAIWSPIVGKTGLNADQVKFESSRSEVLLNGRSVTRMVV